VILSPTFEQISACLDSIYYCKVSLRGVNIGGYICYIVQAHRSAIPFVSPSANSDTWDKDKDRDRDRDPGEGAREGDSTLPCIPHYKKIRKL
jgi:hypothetical protein